MASLPSTTTDHMGLELAAWLGQARQTLIDRWAEVLVHRLPVPEQPVDLTATVVEPIYEAMRLAASGKPAQLEVCLRDLIRSDNGQAPNLNELLAAWMQVQSATREVLIGQNDDPHLVLQLLAPFDALFDQSLTILARLWSERVDDLIAEREFIASSLNAASDAADQRALQLKALNDISHRLSANLEVDPLLDLLMDYLVRLMDVAHVAIWMLEGEADPVLAVVRSHGADRIPVLGMSRPLDAQDDLVVSVFQARRAQLDPTPDASRQGPWYQHGCGILAIPLVVNDQVTGVVTLQDPNPVEQLRLQQDLALGVISQAAIALQNARLYAQVRSLNIELEQHVEERTHELQEEKDRLATLHQISTEVSSTLDLDTLLNTSLELLANITQASHASIMLVEEGSLLVTQAVYGVPFDPTGFTRFPIGTGIAGWVAQQRKAALVADIAVDERWIDVPGGSLRKREGSMVSVPLVVQGEVLGVLTLSHQTVDYFDADHVRLLNACAGAIAIGVNNANLFTMISAEAERRYELLDHQQKEASQIAAILQSLSDGVVVCDGNGSVLTANHAAAVMLQRNLEEVLLWNLHDILSRYANQRRHEMPLSDLLADPLNRSGQPRIFHSTIKIGMRVVSLTLGPVLKENDEMLGALLVLRDITREVEADRLKTEFIGTMSHELRTPMTAIKGFTQLLAMGGLGPLNDTQREFVTTIHNNTERMIAMINDVLDITKIESGSIDLSWRSLHMAEVLSGVMSELQSLISDRQHTLTINIPPGLPLVRADSNRLHQVLYNLVANAAKYTPKGGAISIDAVEMEVADLPVAVRDTLLSEERYVQFSVRDNGVGIAPEEQERIFDRFYRTENPLKIEAGGTGLGLSLVKPLIELMGGRIWVQSQPGNGSNFSFILPANHRA
jgi:signal transduction histidine kinase